MGPRFIKKIIYKLERKMGQPVFLHRVTSVQQDVRTGTDQVFETITKIPRAIVLNERNISDFEYDLSYIASNKNFTYGGIFESGTRAVLMRVTPKLPATFVPQNEDHFEFSGRNWEIKESHEFGTNPVVGLIFIVKELKGSPLNGH